MIEILRVLQILTVLAWGVPLALFGKYVWRRAAGPFDTLRQATAWTAFSVMAFPIRWLVFGHDFGDVLLLEMAIWCALYVGAILAAAFLTGAVADASRGK